MDLITSFLKYYEISGNLSRGREELYFYKIGEPNIKYKLVKINNKRITSILENLRKLKS